MRERSAPLRVLQLYSRDIVGGVRVLGDMIEAELTAQGVVVDELELASTGNVFARLKHLLSVARVLLTGRYDAVFAHQVAASIVMGVLSTLARTPVRASHLSSMPEEITPHWRPLDRIIGSFGGYTHILSNSAATTAAFSNYPRAFTRRIAEISLGVSELRSAGTIDWRAHLGLNRTQKLLVATGRLTDQKDQITAVRALARLPDAVLVIAGEGPQHDRLVAEAKALGVDDRFHLAGTIDRSKIGDLLAAADVYLFPSVWETFGIAGAEALLLGLPIVASDLPVLREVLGIGGRSSDLVRFHPVGDHEALAAEVAATLAAYPSTERRKQVAVLAQQHHSVGRMGQKYRQLVEAAI